MKRIQVSKYPSIRILGFGYLDIDTIQLSNVWIHWIVGYLNFLCIRILGYMDTWISWIPGYLDTWIFKLF